MADFWADKYWNGKYFNVRYFGTGEELPEGSISATLSGSGSVSADLSAVQAAADISATLSGSGSVSADLSIVAIPADISATLSGSGDITANLEIYVEPEIKPGGWIRRRGARNWETPVPLRTEAIPAYINATISGSGSLEASASAIAPMSAKISGAGSVSSEIESVDRKQIAEDNAFWLLAA
jgi:hypothetical protein